MYLDLLKLLYLEINAEDSPLSCFNALLVDGQGTLTASSRKEMRPIVIAEDRRC